MHVLLRSSTSARPRVTSPGVPVSESGMPSPTTTYVRNSWALAKRGRASIAAMSHVPAMVSAELAKCVHRNGAVPGPRVVGFARTRLARRIDGACGAAFDLGESAILRLIDAGQRERIARRDRVVARADQRRRFR